MSRIGKKPIPLPKGVTYAVEGNTVRVKGPKGEVTTHMPAGVKLEQNDGILTVVREDDSKAAVHGLVRALVNNSVEGVTRGWTKELDIVGIGYRAEMKGKATVVFTLGYSHAIEYPLPAGIEVTVDPKQTHLSLAVLTGRRWDSLLPRCAAFVPLIRTRTRACAIAMSA